MEPATLSTAFSVWAAVVALIGAAIVFELARLRSELRVMAERLNDYILGMERRVTHIEAHMQIKHDDFQPISTVAK